MCLIWIADMMLSLANFVQDLTLQEAETIALSILKQVMEEKVKFGAVHCSLVLNICALV